MRKVFGTQIRGELTFFMPHSKAPSSRKGTKTRNHICDFTPALLILCIKRPKANKPVRIQAKQAGSESLTSRHSKLARDKKQKS